MTVKDGIIGLIPWFISSVNYLENHGFLNIAQEFSFPEFLDIKISSTAGEQEIYYTS